ncbi:MAG: hypothetical protein CMK23_03205 [Porticoccaceae bacterium]|nr:hypothetical protein [Porticoccaceae bacterium]
MKKTTRLGKIIGIDDNETQTFLGIRYGEPPINARRFKASLASGGWSNTLDATSFPNRAMQDKTLDADGRKIPGKVSEDCLFLNIYKPKNAKKLAPVLVWMHGGAFKHGSANEFDGSVLAAQQQVVVVTLNFRVGAFGFLDFSKFGSEYLGSASNGIQDCILALQWIQDNIEEYGGDPDNVTISGESSGGTMTLGLLGCPSAYSLYHKAIACSPTCPYKELEDPTEKVRSALNIDSDNYLSPMLEMSAIDICRLELGFRVSIDGEVVKSPTIQAIKSRGKNGVPILVGSNSREGTLYTEGKDEDQPHYELWNHGLAREMLFGEDPDSYLISLKTEYPNASSGKIHEMIWTDMFRRTAIQTALTSSEFGKGGWLYYFDNPANLPKYKDFGATHASEMAFMFNTFDNPNSLGREFHDRNDQKVRSTARKWSQGIANFMKLGYPVIDSNQAWPNYEQELKNCLVINNNFQISQNIDELHEELWSS